MKEEFTAARVKIAETILRYAAVSPEWKAEAEGYLRGLLTPSPERREIWADLPYSASEAACFTAVYRRIERMAAAYAHPDSPLARDAALLDGVRRALRFADQYWYHAELTMEGYDNWWHFTIGTPERYSAALALIWEELSGAEQSRYAAALNHFCDYGEYCCVMPKGTHQRGANLVNLSTYEYRMGVLTGNREKIRHALSEFAKVFPYVDCQPDPNLVDGFYSDGSFLQHGVPYNVNYGREFLSGVVKFFEATAGTRWELGEEHYHTVNEWIDRGIAPLVFRADAMALASGRAIVRKRSDKLYGYELGRTILHYAALLRDQEKRRYYFGMVKGWFLSSTALDHPPLSWRTGCDPLSRSVIEDLDIPVVSDAGLGCWVYSNMDRVVHRPCGDWAFGVSMCSSRIPTYELTNGENAKGWYTGSGMTLLYDADDTQYTDDFWWTVDMKALPGTTAAEQARYTNEFQDGDGEGRTSLDFAGGVSLRNCGIAAMRLEQLGTPPGVSLRANQSYFLFEKEIVCLGSGIHGRSEAGEVYTTIENRRVRSGWRLSLDGRTTELEPGRSFKAENVRFVWLSAGVKGSTIGYVFPDGADLNLLFESRTGNAGECWLRQREYPEDVTRDFVRIWITHGKAPRDAGYAYILLPGAAEEETAAYAETPGAQVIRLEQNCHAVFQAEAGILGLAQFEDGAAEVSAGGLRAGLDRAALLMAAGDGGVAVSDPARAQSGDVTVTLSGERSYPDSEAYTAFSAGGETVLQFHNLAARRGQPVTVIPEKQK